MSILDIIKANPERFEGLDHQSFEATVNKLKEAGFTLLMNDDKAPAYVPKARLDEVIAQKTATAEQLSATSTELENLRKQAKGNAELEAKISSMQGAIDESKNRIKSVSVDAAIKLAAVTLKAHSAEDLLHYIDKSKIAVSDDGTVDETNVLAQISELQKSKPYLFAEAAKPENHGTKPIKGNVPPAGGTANFAEIAKQAIASHNPGALVAAINAEVQAKNEDR